MNFEEHLLRMIGSLNASERALLDRRLGNMGANEIIRAAIVQLGAECHEIARDHGFWPEEGRNDGELVALIHSEASELLEAVRHLNPPSDHLPTPFTLAEEECADIIIRVLDMAHARNWNVAGALLEKLRFNRERPHKHGKAF